MHTIKLIGTGASRVMRPVWLLEELRALCGISYEHDPISYVDPALAAPPYVELNPNARIPILVLDGFAVWESLAINLYLAEKFPTSLSLATLEERALGAQWALWAATSIEQPIMDWAFNTIVKPEAERDMQVALKARVDLQRPFDALNAALAGKTYLIGERFTVADLNTAAIMYRCLKMDLSPWPNVAAWHTRSWDRPAALVPRRMRGEVV